MAAPSLSPSAPDARFPWWVLFGALLIPCLYLPTLATGFDFIDDGNLVYPAAPMPLGERLQLVWTKIVANYEHLGPFRPTLWVHWELEAELLGGNPLYWRIARLVWCMLAAGALLWLLRELGIKPGAALITAALAMWNPYRNEIWTSLTLAEGVAMPYALTALVCALRAARSRRAWAWDLAGALCVLVALGCKNTFAALVPAQMLLRLAPDGRFLWAGWQRHGRRACLLAMTLLMPVAHYIYFKLNWHAGQYVTHGFSLAQLGRMLRAVTGAISIDFVGAGLALTLLVVIWGRRRAEAEVAGQDSPPGTGMTPDPVGIRHPAAFLAGLVLLAAGIGIYLPLDAMSGRYSMPAVWGLDLWIAALLSTLATVPRSVQKKAAYAVLGCGLVAVMVANVGHQDKFAARAEMLRQLLVYVEEQAPPKACLGWVAGSDLDPEEGIHFLWHLHNRGRRDLVVREFDDTGRSRPRSETPEMKKKPVLFISGRRTPLPGGPWHLRREFATTYRFGKQSFQCYLFDMAAESRAALSPTTSPKR